jgi:alkyl sulfatase BDS1-like metallo-beta-lactamase superfamily hydrolase
MKTRIFIPQLLLKCGLMAAFQVIMVLNYSFSQSPSEKLAAHSSEFNKEIIKVADGVYVAIGYGLANSILIEGNEAVIIVDVLGSPEAAEKVRSDFRKITVKPVEAIIYTHSHPDHTCGAGAFIGEDSHEIYAHELVASPINDGIQPVLYERALRQFGWTLPEEEFLNAGIGPWINIVWENIPPTKTFSERLETEIAGINVVLQYAPGETRDQLYVWLPDKKVLLPGDNYYKAFPNLYTIRGSRYRDIRQWAQSLDKMLNEGEIEYLVPSHTRPVTGAVKVRETLTGYRDAILYIYNATVEGINKGMTPVELSRQVKLPPHLAGKPYLQEFYGTVPWSVRAVYAGLLGWFDGNATNLFPLSDRERSERTVKLAGGVQMIRMNAKKVLEEGDAQWAAELADHLLALDENDKEAKLLKADALTILGEQQISANARNYYLTQARQLREEFPSDR